MEEDGEDEADANGAAPFDTKPAGRRGAAKKRRTSDEATEARRAGGTAISSRGHTNRGRVKQKSHKNATLHDAGTLRCAARRFHLPPQGKERVKQLHALRSDL